MAVIRKLERNLIQVETELGTVEIRTTLSDQNLLRIETELGTVEIRMNVVDNVGQLEAVAIQPNDGVRVEGDTMVLLRKG